MKRIDLHKVRPSAPDNKHKCGNSDLSKRNRTVIEGGINNLVLKEIRKVRQVTSPDWKGHQAVQIPESLWKGADSSRHPAKLTTVPQRAVFSWNPECSWMHLERLTFSLACPDRLILIQGDKPPNYNFPNYRRFNMHVLLACVL